MLKSFQLSGIKETNNCTAALIQKLHASGGILHSSPVLIAGTVKTGIFVHGLYTYQGLYFCVPFSADPPRVFPAYM